MSITSQESPIVVAPRPVRLTSAFSFARPTRILSSTSQSHSPSKDPDPNSYDFSSPSPSPLGTRSGLPSEALEEFLSILKPSFFPSSSPTSGRARRSLSIPTFQYDRHISFRPRHRLETLKSDGGDASELRHVSNSTSPDSLMDTDFAGNNDSNYQDDSRIFWFSYGALSSPISRIHTRNPFLKLASDHTSVPVPPLSPAAIPLPLPTPDEMMEAL